MTPKEIRYLMTTATAATNKIYSCRDEAGRLRYWIGTHEKRLREITAEEAFAIQDKNKTTSPSATPTIPTSTGGSPTGTAGGDLGGTYPDPDVVAIQGVPVDSTAPTILDILVFDGSTWVPTAAPAAVTPAALTKVDDTNVTITLTGTPATALLQAVQIALGWTGTLADARIASSGTWNSKVSSVSGTANRVTSTGGATPVIDIDAAYDALWQPTDADLTAIAALGFTSVAFLTKTAANTWALDTNVYLTTAGAAAAYQPLDSDLTAIAALATTAFGRAFLTETDASSTRTTLGLGTIATQNANAVSITGGSVTGITDITVADGGTGASTALAARINLGTADAYNTADQTTAAGVDTTITSITFATAASETWSFECYLTGQVSGAGGAKFTVVYSNVPSASNVTAVGSNTGTNTLTRGITIATTPAQTGTMWAFATTETNAIISGCFTNGASANTVTIKVKPVNGAQTVTIRNNSYLTARRIA